MTNFKYPKITDNDFYNKINKIYNDFKIKQDNRSFDEICNPKKYKLQLPQQFLSEFINPNTPYLGVIVFHQIGSGKTCTAVRIAEKWKKYKRLVIVTPASLTSNFRNELRSMCADNNYLKQDERNILKTLHPSDQKFKEIIKKSDERINEYYEIYSYNKFVENINNKTLNLKNALLIIDEVQNMVSMEGSFYNTLYNAIHSAPKDLRIVLLSATPMFNSPNEFALTMNLLRLQNELPIGKEFDKTFIKSKIKSNGDYSLNVQNIDKFKSYLKGYISYFRGSLPFVFPTTTIKYVECEMSEFQFNAYKQLLIKEENLLNLTKSEKKKLLKSINVSDLPNNFYIGTRMISNIVFPNKKIGEDGYKSLTDNQIKKNLKYISCKFYTIMEKINKCKGKIFVYSNFKEYGGIKSFCKVLEGYGYSDYIINGEGKYRYAIWSGDESVKTKDNIRNVFNNVTNIKGKLLKILILSPSAREGLSLYGIRQAHILDPYWNHSRIMQIIGRGVRYCSHKDLPETQRTIKVYIYIAIAPISKKSKYLQKKSFSHSNNKSLSRLSDDSQTYFETVDQFIRKLASKKDKIIKIFEKAIKEVAVDCSLNKKANVYGDEKDIICDK